MKNLLAIILVFSCFTTFSQNGIEKIISTNNFSIEDIKSNLNCIQNNYAKDVVLRINNGETITIPFSKLVAILNKDVVKYFGLEEKYNSELKVSVFSKTEEYKPYLKDLLVLRNYALNSYFYFSKELGCYNKYNLNNKSFLLVAFTEKKGFYNSNYIQFDDLCILKPSFFKYNDYVKFGGTNYFQNQDIFIPVVDESIALDIENNCRSVELMLIFKLLDVVSLEVPIQGLIYISEFIRTNQITRAIIFDNNTNKVYKYFPDLNNKVGSSGNSANYSGILRPSVSKPVNENYFKVTVDKAYFYNEPDNSTKRKGYLV